MRAFICAPPLVPQGATVQVLLFAVLAVEIKRKCPTIHTFTEIIKYRWGTTAHIVFIVYAFLVSGTAATARAKAASAVAPTSECTRCSPTPSLCCSTMPMSAFSVASELQSALRRASWLCCPLQCCCSFPR